jgi:hypothetical protein
MIVPSSIDTMIVRGATTVPALGRSIPKATNRAFMPFAMPMPRTSPTSEARRPMIRPSSTTERRTCLREAPRVRRVANSRVRWATVIERVLKITNAPTNSAMPPKPSRKIRTKLMPSLVSFAASLASSAASLTSTLAGTSVCTAFRTAAGELPSLAVIEISSYWPSWRSRAWAVGMSKTAMTAPPIESTSPNRAIPVIVYCSTGPLAETPIVSPTA